ncbi:MAG: FAD-dependent oxidoreductase [Candidatus Bathyarchaeota archaeon]|nr:MAG: FAD-dependent oxidoreductase [Candidatus Bathyarchaeota archaeon]
MDHDSVKRLFPPCRLACPAHVNIQAYVSLVSNGRFSEALEVIRKQNPFPAVCGRVCFSPCEEECQRNNVDSPVSIRLLKRLVADIEFSSERAARAEPVPRRWEERIAVVGSGPSGLTAAYELVKMGYHVTVFEREPKPGGMLRSCLPLYRLPEDVLDAEIRFIIDSGVDIKTNVEIGEDIPFDDLWTQGFKVVFVATGAPRSLSLRIEGEDLEGVFQALDFLRIAHSEDLELRGRVAVIGGGDVAIDSARTAIRLGPEDVTVIYRRQRGEMPARAKEVDEAEREGVNFEFLASPTRILGLGRVSGIECVRMRLGELDDSGRRHPIRILDSEFELPVDFVVEAIGETADLSFLFGDIATRWRTIEADPTTCETNIARVFAGGDVVTGPASVIDAIASGRRAARAIDLYLRGGNLDALREEELEETSWVKKETALERKSKQEEAHIPVEARRCNFSEVELGLTQTQGMIEALRCLHCGPCSECLVEEDLCEHESPEVDTKDCSGCGTCVTICPFDVMEKDEDGIAKVNEDACKGCGICAASCPERAITIGGLTGGLMIEAVAD